MNYKKDQYTLWQVLGIWLAAGAPMGLLGWVAYPVMSAGLSPVDAGLLRIKLLTVGLMWQFVLAMIIVNALFNTVLGEEFLFRGALLPKMEGLFGKWDWVANGVVFGLYHLHQPWGVLSSVLTGIVYAFSSKRFHSNWFSIILHSGQSVFMLFLILGLVLGLA